jgi:hypothetical protein
VETKPEEQLNPVDALMVADEIPADPTPEPPVDQPPVEPPPDQGEVEPPAEQTPPPSEPAPAAPPQDQTPPDRKVPLGTYVRTRRKNQELRQEMENLRKENEQLRQTQAQEVDPLQAWTANPENEGLAPAKEILQQHDAFIRAHAVREAQRPPEPVDLQQRVAYADQLIDRDPNTKAALGWAMNRGVLDQRDLLEIAQDANPVAKARELVRESFEAEGNPTDLAVLNQLFPPPVAPPAPKPAAPKAAAPPAPAPQPKPKPQETTDESDLPQFPKESHAASVVDYLFRRR